MLVSTATHHDRRLIDYKKAPKSHQNKRKQQQEDDYPSKKVKLDTARINHQERVKQTGVKKKLPEYQVSMAKSQPIQQNSQISKLQIDSKQSTESHSIPTILN